MTIERTITQSDLLQIEEFIFGDGELSSANRDLVESYYNLKNEDPGFDFETNILEPIFEMDIDYRSIYNKEVADQLFDIFTNS